MAMSRLGFLILVLAVPGYVPAPGRPAAEAKTARAVFAAGCFCCLEAPFDELPGVLSSTSGYAGGPAKNPTYEQVSSGTTGHAEAVQVLYDPNRITYARLLDVFWHNIDPLDKNGQCDRGSQYRSAIFYDNEEQRGESARARAGVGLELLLARPHCGLSARPERAA